jgi:t-SNARE complex subunit (syntaxin)
MTTITADASHRDSWLAQQQRKAKHRTWICWCFWIIFLLVVAGVVVTVLVLKAHKII